jgi:linoleoyl-CoA desaturase
MKKTRFVSQAQQQQQFVAALRKNVNAYFKENGISQKGNFSVGVQIATMLALYVTPYVLVLSLPMAGWAAALMCVLAGIGLAGIGMCVMHGGAHGAISNREWVNKLLGATMNLLGNTVFTWKVQHNLLHHTYTNIDGMDRDIDSKGPIRLCDHAPLHKIHRYQYIHAFFFYGMMTFSMLVKDFVQLRDYHRQGITAKQKVNVKLEYLKMIAIKVVHVGLFIGLPILLTDFAWWQVLIGFAIMHWTGGFILSVIFQLAHVVEGVDQPLPNSEGVIENDWIIHELQTTANFARNNKLLGWYVGGLNFQVEHHLFPNICHVHYPQIAPIVEKTALEYGYPYIQKPTFLAAIASHIHRLRQLGKPALQNLPSH